MKIFIARTAGFCMGVRRAVEMALDMPRKYKGPIFTFGPLIHNPQVIGLLEQKGITVINSIPEKGTGTVLIRAHGVPPGIKKKLKNSGFTVIDATCPRVIKVQTIIGKHTKQGFASIIIGDKNHPEVIGLLGYAGGKGYVVSKIEDLESLPEFEKAIIVAQTTQNIVLYESVKKWVEDKYPYYRLFDTICNSTLMRQSEVKEIAKSADAIVVVGGHSSGNTQRLAEAARQAGKPSYHIETESELDLDALSSARSIGITAGASTPNWLIKRVYRTIENYSFNRTRGRRKHFYAVERSLLLTNIYVSIGAGCLCYASIKLLCITGYLPYVVMAMLYVLSMHIFNNLIGRKADYYNDPDRAAFYKKHQILLSSLAVSAGGAGLLTAYSAGLTSFLVLLSMSIMGLSYNLTVIPEGITKGRYRSIRDLPGSKTALISAAWGVVTALLPALSSSFKPGIFVVFTWSVCMVFVRTAFFDILDMQGDRIVGKETIPIIIGEVRTMRLLKYILVAMAALLIVSGTFGFISKLGIALSLCPLSLLFVLIKHERGHMLPGTKLEFLVESHLVITGGIALLWQFTK
ncbi:MAG: 4-hydroxy-3-methylbut-2-enyl diphosphate reductase [Desulfobacteraceae bacterium]|nr:MAG: 4-hydroxy-3-methylbut-2-enyl diphosphate reductase [Desulfobacteraceae bacterium]